MAARLAKLQPPPTATNLRLDSGAVKRGLVSTVLQGGEVESDWWAVDESDGGSVGESDADDAEAAAAEAVARSRTSWPAKKCGSGARRRRGSSRDDLGGAKGGVRGRKPSRPNARLDDSVSHCTMELGLMYT